VGVGRALISSLTEWGESIEVLEGLDLDTAGHEEDLRDVCIATSMYNYSAWRFSVSLYACNNFFYQTFKTKEITNAELPSRHSGTNNLRCVGKPD
jgi:hypothetical protein